MAKNSRVITLCVQVRRDKTLATFKRLHKGECRTRTYRFDEKPRLSIERLFESNRFEKEISIGCGWATLTIYR